MTRLGIVTGLAAEARILRKAARRAGRAGPLVACAGHGPERAQAAAADLARRGAGMLVSFGLCGGLDPALRPGALILPEAVVRADREPIETEAARRAALVEALRRAGLESEGGRLFASERPVASAADKAALFAGTGARAVDMESQGVGRAAGEAGVPFVVLRAIGDPAERDLPRAALKATGPDGRLRLVSAIATMYLRPWESPALIRLAYEARLGLDALEAAADALAGLFGGD